MALQPPFDEAVKPIMGLFSKFSNKLNGLQNELTDKVNEMQQLVTGLPDNIDCNDPRINKLKELLERLNDIIAGIQKLFQNVQLAVNILIIIATIAAVAIAISLALVLPTNNAIVKALEVSSYVVATILGVLGLISLGLNMAVDFVNSLPDQLSSILDKLSSTCSNESFIINTLNRTDGADQFSDMTTSEFYRSVNVSETDLKDREQKIEKLLDQQRSLIDNLIEAPSNVLTDSGLPESDSGDTGDYYINIDTNKIFGPKISDIEWGTALN